MKIAIASQKITEAIKKIEKPLVAKSPVPILSGALVQAENNCILFTGSDGTDTIIYRVPVEENTVEILAEGATVLPKEALDVTKKLKGIITIEIDGTKAIISQDKLKLEFGCMDAEEYPKIEGVKTMPITFSGEEFSHIVSKTYFYASESEVRPILQGVKITISKDGNTFVATDSHRLGYITFGKYDGEHSLVVHAKTLENALKIFDLNSDVMMFPEESHIALCNGNTIYKSRLLDGNYPEVKRLIPNEFQSELVVNKQELLDSLEIFSTISNNGTITLTIGGLFVEIKSSSETTRGQREISFESYDGEDGFQISLSVKYLMKTLKAINSNSVKLCFNGSMKPVVIKPMTDEAELEIHLILPIRTTTA